jgi:hypothetical protein
LPNNLLLIVAYFTGVGGVILLRKSLAITLAYLANVALFEAIMFFTILIAAWMCRVNENILA